MREHNICGVPCKDYVLLENETLPCPNSGYKGRAAVPRAALSVGRHFS